MTNIIQMPQLQIRSLDSEQIAEAASLVHTVWHATYRDHLPASLVEQRTHDHFCRHLERRVGHCWLASVGSRSVGLCTTTSNCVDDVWVSQRFRRRGIASRLIAAACSHLEQRGFKAAQAGCEDFNLAATALFEGLGWRKTGAELVRLAPGVRHEAFVYTRSLTLEEAL